MECGEINACQEKRRVAYSTSTIELPILLSGRRRRSCVVKEPVAGMVSVSHTLRQAYTAGEFGVTRATYSARNKDVKMKFIVVVLSYRLNIRC